MRFTELKSHLATGNYLAAYTLYGDDRYLLTHAKKLFADRIALPEWNINVFDASADPRDVVAACVSMPMRSERRLVRYEDFKTLDKTILAYLNEPSPDTILLLCPSVSPKLTGADKRSELVDCNRLEKPFLLAWIKKESGGRIEPTAADLLVEYTMRDLARIGTEVPKLLSFAADRSVTEEDVRRMVVRDSEYKMYELTQAIAEGRTDLAYGMVASLVREIDPLALIKSIHTHFHKLLHVRISRASEEEIAASFGVKTFALKHLRAQAKRFSPVKLKSAVDYLADCDYRVKTGRMTSAAALDNILLRIFALGETA